MKIRVLFLLALFCMSGVAASAWADAIIIRPGSRVTIFDGPAEVACEGAAVEPFVRYCKCAPAGFARTYELNITLNRDGATDVLGSYDLESDCLTSLKANPACAGK